MTYVQSNRTIGPSSREIAGNFLRSELSLADFGRGCTELEFTLADEDHAFWCYLKPQARPSFTPALLCDLHRVQGMLETLARRAPGEEAAALRWVVLASRTPGVFNLGGDLVLFAEKIRAGDRAGLRRYAYSCIETVFRNWAAYKGDVITIGLAQGDALGGGFEALLSFDVIVAERRARFGLPEILFNLFPGMGAQSLLIRRLGATRAQEIMMSGKVFTAEEMQALGIVDVLAEDGEGERVVREYVHRNKTRHNAHAAIYKARRRVNPVTMEEMRDVADIWVDAAFRLQEHDLRRMTHLAAAQDRSRRRTATVPSVAAE